MNTNDGLATVSTFSVWDCDESGFQIFKLSCSELFNYAFLYMAFFIELYFFMTCSNSHFGKMNLHKRLTCFFKNAIPDDNWLKFENVKVLDQVRIDIKFAHDWIQTLTAVKQFCTYNAIQLW